ncbi:MAG: hypothetical protein H6Q68_1928 [Firmicutes bacterium]|nr:hypothetical protein [Bacillota bacterium]
MISFFLICLILMPGIAKASDDVVEKVTVSITASQTPTNRIAKRMSASVGTVGEQMLIGRNISDVVNGKAAYEKLIQEIFDRVLVGYSVQSVHLVPDSNTLIQVAVAPWGEVVHEVALEVDFGAVSPEITDLLKKDLGNIEEKVNDVLIGLPIDALDWAGGVSKLVIREVLASQLPEFRANFDIVPGSRTVVKLSLAPMGATIQDVDVSLRSHTIPNILLLAARPTVEQAGKSLIGLPVAFIERHQDYFTAKLGAAANQHPSAKRYGLTITPVINPGVDTTVAIDAETDKYKVALEGYLDMGRSKDNTSFKLHVGKFIGKQDEAFLELDFIPSTVTWDFVPGWGHSFSTRTTAGIKYNLSDQHNIVWLHQSLNQNLTLRLEHTPAIHKNEIGIRYKMHDFLSAEYIVNKEDRWLRFIGSL